MKLPRRVFNSPLILYANLQDGSCINLIRLIKPYANGKAYAIYNASKDREHHNGMFRTLEQAQNAFYKTVRETLKETQVTKMAMTKNY